MIPAFIKLRYACHVEGSRIESLLRHGSYWNPGKKYIWMMEVACRYVRRFKPLAVDASRIQSMFLKKHGASHTFYELFPSSKSSIGFLIVKGWRVTATGHPTITNPDEYVNQAAAYRDQQIEKLTKKNKLPEGEMFRAFVLSTELDMYIKLKSKDFEHAYKRRSNSQKQAWIRRQQSRHASINGGCDQLACQDHV